MSENKNFFSKLISDILIGAIIGIGIVMFIAIILSL